MRKSDFLNSEIIKVLSDMGHTDQIIICDAGLPIPKEVKKIDLALIKGLPSFLQVLQLLKDEMVIEKIVIAQEIKDHNEEIYNAIKQLFPETLVEFVTHERFKALSVDARAVVRTGECSPYANIILQSGVIF
jgi:D-ribose pyranase